MDQSRSRPIATRVESGETSTTGKNSGSLIRLATIAAGGLLLIGAALGGHNELATASTSESFVASLGDRIRIEGTPVGCRVTRVAGHGRRAYIECRRTGTLKGTYGALFSGKDVLIARFLGPHKARVVYRASHSGPGRDCS
jgi:hypothetical protein